MIWQDLVNAIFEGGMAFAILPSVLRLYRDKKVLGLHWFMIAFPTAWGFWNLYYYPWLGQYLSFWGGLAVVIVNVIYLSMIFHYLRAPHRRRQQEKLDVI